MSKLTGKGPNFRAIRDHLFDRIHLNGEQMKNDFPNILRTAIDTETWRHFSHADGRPFENIVEWLVCPFPIGLGMGQGRHVISYEDALTLTKSAPDVHQVLLENAPHNEHGGDRRSKAAKNQVASTPLDFNRHNRTNTATVLSVRLAQEKPKYYEAYMRGRYKSVTAAAIAAGLVKNDGNLRRAKSAIRKMTEEEYAEFLAWFQKWRRSL